MSTLTSTKNVDAVLEQHARDRLEVIVAVMDDYGSAEPEDALARVSEIAERPLHYSMEDAYGLDVDGCFPVFEECEVYVPCDGLSDAEIIRRAVRALRETGCDDVDVEPPSIDWRGHVLLLAEHTEDNDIMFWFRRVDPDPRAILMAHVS